MTPYIKTQDFTFIADTNALTHLREFLENNYSSELHDIYDTLCEELSFLDNKMEEAEGECEDLQNIEKEMNEMKREIGNLIEDKDVLDYEEFVSELERINF